MKNKILTYNIYNLIMTLLGVALVILSCLESVDEFWSGMGAALLVMGVVRTLRIYRLNKNEAYREKMETASTDERLHFIRTKAWAWAGYLFIIITALAVILLQLVGQSALAQAAGYAMCLLLILHWVSFWILSKKY